MVVPCESAGAVVAGDDDVLHPFIEVNQCVPTTLSPQRRGRGHRHAGAGLPFDQRRTGGGVTRC